MQSIIQSIVNQVVIQKEIQKAKSKYFNTECPICLDTPKDENLVVRLECDHFICKDCLDLYINLCF